jgi:hypothetical protein
VQDVEVSLVRKILRSFLGIHRCNLGLEHIMGKGISLGSYPGCSILSFRAKKKPALSAAKLRNLDYSKP